MNQHLFTSIVDMVCVCYLVFTFFRQDRRLRDLEIKNDFLQRNMTALMCDHNWSDQFADYAFRHDKVLFEIIATNRSLKAEGAKQRAAFQKAQAPIDDRTN